MTLTRRTLGLAGLSGLGLASCAPRPSAQGRTIFDAVDVHPGDFPTVTAVRWMGEELGRLTDGRLGIRQYPSGQLGSEDDSIGLARHGALRMARRAGGPDPGDDALRADLAPLVDRYRAAWLARSRPGGLDDSIGHLARTLRRYQRDS